MRISQMTICGAVIALMSGCGGASREVHLPYGGDVRSQAGEFHHEATIEDAFFVGGVPLKNSVRNIHALINSFTGLVPKTHDEMARLVESVFKQGVANSTSRRVLDKHFDGMMWSESDVYAMQWAIWRWARSG